MPQSNEKKRLSAEQVRRRLSFDDSRLLAECEVHTHRIGGPGGQHRNKTETAIRLVHEPSGIVVTAGETRSQHVNRSVALRRLREAIAVETRLPIEPIPVWPDSVSVRDRRLRVSAENPGYPAAVALVLDHVVASAGEIAQAAERLGVTTSNLTRFLGDHPRAWAAANGIRKQFGLHALRRD
jgi:hypothetical protein